ncbi:TPA: hypothetical protein N0F65_008104 [Lagenidium giganteum]|uniref:DnaJ homologue subfamily C GRV2/DNAJC13 N-terminal domain-containing protein n=1 Tax=Lagenidium giganteum TaxID=4803 RepID=A0AAV2Z1H8_9STRA|nr:TPA: hypothetical protein N0F65_008104 [Lagenidium giganteum]
MSKIHYEARFMVHKVGNFGLKERVLCFGEGSFATFDQDGQVVTNSWSYDEVENAGVIDGEESDFYISTPKHKVKKTVYRCNYRMEILVCLMRLRCQFQAKVPGRPVPPQLQTFSFRGLKHHKKGLQSACVVEVRPDGIYQVDKEGEAMSHIPYTSLVSLDVICDNHEAILLNHSDNSSLFLVENRTELAQRIHRMMESYGMRIYEYRKKTMEAAAKDDNTSADENMSVQFPVLKVSSRQKPLEPRILSISEKFISERIIPDIIISSRPLSRIYSLIMPVETTDTFEIVFVDGVRRVYSSEYREKILCELLVSCHSLGNTQVDVVSARTPDWIRMLPRKFVQLEGGKLVKKSRDVDVLDRELRVAQSTILQRFAAHGSRKAAATQRNRLGGPDDDMHLLAMELNANTSTSGVIPQPNKPFDKVLYIVMKEIREVSNRYGARHEYVGTYLQSVYRLIMAPPAIKELLVLLDEHADDYFPVVCDVLRSKNAVSIYWMLSVLARLLESTIHKFRFRELLLSDGRFLTTVLSLFEEDPQTRGFLSELPTMKLCQLVFSLVRTNIDSQTRLSQELYERLATKYRMVLRILFSFPGLGTVEASVGILSRMTKNPSLLYFSDEMEDAQSSHNMSKLFGGNINGALRLRHTVSSVSSMASTIQGGVEILLNPELLLRQYRFFVESPCGPNRRSVTSYHDSIYLRLRYRCRNIFLQDLLGLATSKFEDFKRVFTIRCFEFSGFLGKENGQREKSDIIVGPRAARIVRSINRHAHEIEYSSVEQIVRASYLPDAFTIRTNGKLKHVYSDQVDEIIRRMKELAGLIGIDLRVVEVDNPPRQAKRPLDSSKQPDGNREFTVTKMCFKVGILRLKQKTLVIGDDRISEVGEYSTKTHLLRDLRLLSVLGQNVESELTQIGLEFRDGTRTVFGTDQATLLVSVIYDGCRLTRNWNVSLARTLQKTSPRLAFRALLNDDYERFHYLNHDGFVAPAYVELVGDIEKLNGEAIVASASMERVMFTFDNLITNVDVEDFSVKSLESKLPTMQFENILRCMIRLLEQSCKSPLRVHEITTMLGCFCRINDGCFKLSEVPSRLIDAFTSILMRLVQSGDELPMIWAILSLHSLISDKTRSSAKKSLEKELRTRVLEQSKFLQVLVDKLDGSHPTAALAILHLLVDLLITSRSSTDNNHFDLGVRLLSSKHQVLLQFANQRTNIGLAVNSLCVLKTAMDHCDLRARQRMSDAALESGMILKDLFNSFFHEYAPAREMYQYICAIWMVHHKHSYELLSSIFPRGLMRMIASPVAKKLIENDPRKEPLPRGSEVDSFVSRMLKAIELLSPVEKSRVKVKEDTDRVSYIGESAYDLRILGKLVWMDHELPDLIWNSATRRELKDSLLSAIESYSAVTSERTNHETAWNYQQYRVDYGSLSHEVKVNNYYLRIILKKRRDGSLRLADVSKFLDEQSTVARDAATELLNSSDEGHVILSMLDVVRAPTVFFNDIYQSWLEQLHLSAFPVFGDVSGPYVGKAGSVFFSASPDLNEGCDLMLKTLIEVARAFPSVRSVSVNRGRFFMQVLKNSCLQEEIQDVLELLALVSSSGVSTRHFCCASDLGMFLYLATLGHNIDATAKFLPGGTSYNVDEEDVPIMELRSMPESYSFSSITSYSFHANDGGSKWRVKHSLGDGDDSIVGGPYSVMELKNYLESSTQGNRLGSTMFLCCCSGHERNEQDHLWQSFFEFPELRWMNLTNSPVDPETVAMNALRILSNIVRNEALVANPATYIWPVPVAKGYLSEKHSLALLSQLLLVKKPYMRRLVCEILLQLPEATVNLAFKYGALFFVFLHEIDDADDQSFCIEAELLKRLHRIQECNERRPGQSFLMDMLPEALIRILDSEPPEVFASIFCGRKVDKRVLWTRNMRQQLREVVTEHLEEFTAELARNCGSTYFYVPLPPVSYKELSGDVYCSGFYLSTLADGDQGATGEDGAELDTIEEPLVVMSSIEDRWRALTQRTSLAVADEDVNVPSALKVFGWSEGMSYTALDLRERFRDLCTKELEVSTVRAAFDTLFNQLERNEEHATGQTSVEIISYILQAQLRLLEKFSLQFFSFESQTLDLLLKLVQQGNSDDASARDLQNTASQILLMLMKHAPANVGALVTTPDCWDVLLDTASAQYRASEGDRLKNTVQLICAVLATDEGLTSIIAAKSEDQSAPKSTSYSAPLSINDDLDDGAYFDGFFQSPGSQSVPSSAKRLCGLLDNMLSVSTFRQNFSMNQLLLELVTSMSADYSLQRYFLVATSIFWKAFHFVLISGDPVASMDSDKSALREKAFGVTRVLAIGKDGATRTQAYQVLSNLLPAEILASLNRPTGHDFYTMLYSDIREPTCVWNENIRMELVQLTEEYCSYDGDEGYCLSNMESAATYFYDTLKSEPCINQIYLQVLIELAEDDPHSIAEATFAPVGVFPFVESLFHFLDQNQDPSLGIYSETEAVLRCVSMLIDIPFFQNALVDCLELHVGNRSPVSVATLGRYLLPFDRKADPNVVSISSRRSLSNYGFKSKKGSSSEDDAMVELENAFGNVDYLIRQDRALYILMRICEFPCNLERILTPFCDYAWALQAIADHLDYEQAYHALSCLADLCSTCLVIAQYCVESGLWVEILGLAIQSRQHVIHEHFIRADALRLPAWEILYALLNKDFSLRERMFNNLARFLPHPLIYQIDLDPETATAFFEDDHDSSDLIWNSRWRMTVRNKLDEIICRNRDERSKIKRDSVILDEANDFVRWPENYRAGLYLDRFLVRPDPSKLTLPLFNLEQLYRLWRMQLDELFVFDIDNPPENLKEIIKETDKLTEAILHILRAQVLTDSELDQIQLPQQIFKLIRYCNRNLVSSFPYRCILKLARQMVQFPEMQSSEFMRLLFCRLSTEHQDTPQLIKLVRRVLDERVSKFEDDEEGFWLRDLPQYPQVNAFLESLVAKKQDMDSRVISNVHRILRIFKSEQSQLTDKEARQTSVSLSFISRYTRWQNRTLNGPESRRVDDRSTSAESITSFDVDFERQNAVPSRQNGTFNVDKERSDMMTRAPPSSITIDTEALESDNDYAPLSPVPPSTNGALFDIASSNVRSQKDYGPASRRFQDEMRSSLPDIQAGDLEFNDDMILPPPSRGGGRRGSLPDVYHDDITELSSSQVPRAPPSSHIHNLMSWRGTGSVTDPLTRATTISRRGRRGAYIVSRKKTVAAGWNPFKKKR